MMIKSAKNKKKAFTLIEIIVVLALIGILSTLLSVYVISSSKLSNNIKKDYDAVSESRIAMSYLVNLIQQNDRSNAIKLDDAKLLTVEAEDNVGSKRNVEIYYDAASEKLMERVDGTENEIAKIASYDIKHEKVIDGNVGAFITITIGYKDVNNNDNVRLMNQEISLRSENYK